MRYIMRRSCLFLVMIAVIVFTGCGQKKKEDPVTVTLWHVYGGQTESPLNDLIDEFNETIGKEENIRVQVGSVTNTNTIHENVLASAFGDPGASKLPDMFVSYPKTVLAMPDDTVLVDYYDYFSEEELDGFIPAFLEEGVIHERLSILPVAKSTEVMFINKTAFDRFAKETGHRVTELLPSLVPMEVRQWYAKELQGLSLRNIEICITDGKKKLYEEFGEMLFTHYGVTGPVILSASSVVGKTLRKKELTLHIDLKPALSEEQLDKRILREFDANHNKQYKNSIDSLFPAKLKPVMIELSEIEPEKKVNEITKEERQRLVHLIKDFTMTLTGLRGYNEAIITKGGVSVKEIDPGTMESKKMKGLYFAGEVLDLDAVTGGYNLQIAWSTGYLAGINAGCD